MPVKKIKAPVNTKKSKPKPQLRKRIVTPKKTFNDIKMPEISGIAGGIGGLGGSGMDSLGFDLAVAVDDLFGSDKSMGNELEGTFFDLKQTEGGDLSEIGKFHKEKSTEKAIDAYYEAIARFMRGWDLGRLDGYYQAPKNKYATFFYVPMDASSRATKAFGVNDTVKPDFWMAYYEGYIVAPETGRYRFWGYGDDILVVRIKQRLVLDAGFPLFRNKLGSGWESDDDDNRMYPIGRKSDLLYVGDWIRLKKGEAVKMEVLIGDVGTECSSHLLIQQEGVEYAKESYTCTVHKNGEKVTLTGIRPILPLFKMGEVPPKLHSKMKINPKEVTLDGPVFGAAGSSK